MIKDETGWLIERHSLNGRACMDYVYVESFFLNFTPDCSLKREILAEVPNWYD